MERPTLIEHGLASFRVYGERFLSSDYCRASREDRNAVDAWLVAMQHPLSMEPGTAEGRFLAIVRELSK